MDVRALHAMIHQFEFMSAESSPTDLMGDTLNDEVELPAVLDFTTKATVQSSSNEGAVQTVVDQRTTVDFQTREERHHRREAHWGTLVYSSTMVYVKGYGTRLEYALISLISVP